MLRTYAIVERAPSPGLNHTSVLDFEEIKDGPRRDDDGLGLAHRDIVVIGASAGGVEAMKQIVRELPADFPGSVFVVIHIAPTAHSVLPAILSRNGALPARHPHDGDPIERGVIYVAPPDRHLMIDRGRVRLVRGPTENGTRPAVDVLFRSAANAYGPRVIGVVLSGNLDDGTAGLAAIKRCNGIAIVQDPEDAPFPGMPTSAIEHVDVDRILPLSAIPDAIVSAAGDPVGENAPCRDASLLRREVQVVEFDDYALAGGDRPPLPPGLPSGFTCPDCHGGLWEIEDGGLIRYRCRVGHAYSPETLVAKDSDAVEEALWVAYRSLEESAALARRMEARSRTYEHTHSAERFASHAAELEGRATVLRNVLVNATSLTAAKPESLIGPE